MTIRLIATDLDDTLLNEAHRISEKNKTALQAAAAKGVMVTMATGRMFASARHIAAELGVDLPLISYNGAYIATVQGGEVLAQETLDKELASTLIREGEAAGFHVQLYVNDHLYVRQITAGTEEYMKTTGVQAELLGDLCTDMPGRPLKLLMMGDGEALDAFAVQMRLRWPGKIYAVKSRPRYLEFLSPQVNKGVGVATLARRLGIPKAEIMGIGDNYNDLDLFSGVGLKIAVGNAVPELKAAADWVSADNEHDGVALAVERFVLSPA